MTTASETMGPDLEPTASWVPQRFRAFVRSDELWLVGLAALVGVFAGVGVAAIVSGLHGVQFLLFGTTTHDVSGAVYVAASRAAFVPIIGGMLLGVTILLATRLTKSIATIDPIEANALFGGRIPMAGSAVLVLQTIISSGFGASIGMEAGYTQLGSAAASKLGQIFHVRRNDMRVLVGCGAAGAIAAAFDAPLTGAFYAFELVIASYAIASLAPVVVASIAAVASMRLLIEPSSFQVGFAGTLSISDYALVLTMGVACSVLGISLMRLVAMVEAAFVRLKVPAWLRPSIGGAAVGLMALITPAILSSGHAALHVGFGADYSMATLLLLIGLKTAASAVSLGSGFRGGLFFASLFLGAMLGKLVAIWWMMAFGLTTPVLVFGIVGMCAMATAVLGAPLTMAFLALETTGSLPLTTAVLGAAVVSSITVRRTFGYSFATWRFHLRGESIRSAADIGWIRELTVGRMMRKDVRTVRADITRDQLKRDFPLGSAQRVIAVDEAEQYLGIVLVSDLHRSPDDDALDLTGLLKFRTTALEPRMNVREAMKTFSAAESDGLAVISDVDRRTVVGFLSEQHALRRYSEEMDRRASEIAT
ncbi:chloride channel protein [Rhizobium sp. AU243]|uniref:chloride channel protein n=1 Tax=Rhizobium sp. AU243 TaxID=2303425 RepID=UPI0010CBA432|nr:chloride channel protein [Rhizobium sp. AU243]TKV70771.1 chloride channel protein [Rhizobium sp. AU243]